jgi:hypothetical protein
MITNQTMKNRINRELHSLATYFPAIPIDAIFNIVETHTNERVIQEDGTAWGGLLCGEDGRANFAISAKRFSLTVEWHKMPSGVYEINAYVS